MESCVDLRRNLASLTIDPTGRLAATTDSFGRVLLLDLLQNIIVKIWKGYRDAQCGWVQYPEVAHTDSGKGK